MTKDAALVIERLTKEAAGRVVEIDGREYSTVPLHDPRRPEPVPAPLDFSTLSSFADYVAAREDKEYRDQNREFVHVGGPTEVRLCTGIFGEHRQRAVLCQAEALAPPLAFGTWCTPEQFIVTLLALFEPTPGREAIFRLVGNLKDESVRTFADDGVTQQATARKGVAGVGNVSVPNPVPLRPYRTFSEVEQPESPFILRLNGGGEGKLPQCALFEADGGRWRLAAIESIKAWLRTRLDDVAIYG